MTKPITEHDLQLQRETINKLLHQSDNPYTSLAPYVSSPGHHLFLCEAGRKGLAKVTGEHGEHEFVIQPTTTRDLYFKVEAFIAGIQAAQSS